MERVQTTEQRIQHLLRHLHADLLRLPALLHASPAPRDRGPLQSWLAVEVTEMFGKHEISYIIYSGSIYIYICYIYIYVMYIYIYLRQETK